MTRDVRFFLLTNNDCQPIITEISTHPQGYLLKMDIAIFQIWPTDAKGYAILSVSEEIDQIVRKYGAEEKNDLIRTQLKERNSFPLVFGEETLVEHLKYIIPYSPSKTILAGESKRGYVFDVFNIEDEIRVDANGIYIFTVTRPDPRTGEKNSHVHMSFESIRHNNVEAIKKAKEKGALYIWYYYSGSEIEINEIIADLKASDWYKYQLETFPDLVTP